MRLILLSRPAIQIEISETDQGQIYSLLTFGMGMCLSDAHVLHFQWYGFPRRWEFPVPSNIDDPQINPTSFMSNRINL